MVGVVVVVSKDWEEGGGLSGISSVSFCFVSRLVSLEVEGFGDWTEARWVV